MIQRYIRCENCKDTYLWNSYDQSPESNTRYCPECQFAINRALQTITPKFERRYRPTSELPQFSDVTWESILAWEEDLQVQRQTSLVPQRIGVGLFDLETGDHQNVRWVHPTSGPHMNEKVSFKVSSWKMRPENTIELGMEFDLANQVFTGEVWREKHYKMPEEPVTAIEPNWFIDYTDEYQVTMTSLGPTPNQVRQYLRKRFVYTLAEVLKVQIPITLLSSINQEEANRVKAELIRLGAEVWVKWKEGGPNNDTYPRVRLSFLYPIE